VANRCSGLTLIELMVTLAVAIVLFAVGIPLYDNIQRNNRGVSQVNAMVAAINLARSEAVKTGNPVSVCPKADWSQTVPASIACGDQDDWAQGWIVFNDGDADGDYEAAADLIRVFAPPAWEARRFADGVAPFTVITQTPTDPDFLVFNGRGELDSVPITLNIYMQDCSGNRQRALAVNAVGRLSSTPLACP
jgi:type IV fimbrial biogenesis protein FimT